MAENIFPKLSEFSPEELVFIADEHDDEAFALALGQHPAMIKEDGFCEILSGIKDPFANMAFGMKVPDAENRVKTISEKLDQLHCPAYFWVGPCTEPDNLDEVLLRNGWVHLASPPAMLVDLDQLITPPVPESFELKRVKNAEDLATWRRAVARGFGLLPEVAEMFSMTADDQARLYTAFLGNEVVGTTALITVNGVAGIYCVCTFPEFRGRGVGAALTTVPLLEAYEEGYRIGTLQASSMGLPIYSRLGFKEVCKLKMFGYGLP